MCQAGLKQRWNTRKLVVDKGCKKYKKIHFYQSRRSQHIANACWTSSLHDCVCVNMHARGSKGDVLRFVTVADRLAAIMFARRIGLGLLNLTVYIFDVYIFGDKIRSTRYSLTDHQSTSLTIHSFANHGQFGKKLELLK